MRFIKWKFNCVYLREHTAHTHTHTVRQCDQTQFLHISDFIDERYTRVRWFPVHTRVCMRPERRSKHKCVLCLQSSRTAQHSTSCVVDKIVSCALFTHAPLAACAVLSFVVFHFHVRECAPCAEIAVHTIKYKICSNKSVKSHIEQINECVRARAPSHSHSLQPQSATDITLRKIVCVQRKTGVIVLCMLCVCVCVCGHVGASVRGTRKIEIIIIYTLVFCVTIERHNGLGDWTYGRTQNHFKSNGK